MAGKKMSAYQPLDDNEKAYFLDAGEGAVVAVGTVDEHSEEDTRRVLLSELPKTVDWADASTIQNHPMVYDSQEVPHIAKKFIAGTGLTFSDSEGWLVIDLASGGSGSY